MDETMTPPGAGTRRAFIGRVVKAAPALALGGAAYGVLEAKWCRVTRETLRVRNLPPALHGLRVALITDVHHGRFVPPAYVRAVVAMANAQRPDLVVLGGDYVHGMRERVAAGIAEFAGLRAPMGVFGVIGNHDVWNNCYTESVSCLRQAGVRLLLNSGEWITRGTGRLRLAGVADLWTMMPHAGSAIGDATGRDAVVLVSHNPDFAEKMDDDRVGLMLSGHTHGGQVRLPGYGAPLVPSRYGRKYSGGFVEGPRCPVFVSRGVGTVTPPVRFLCRPEVNILTLT
jgi:hypothetical protein